MFAEKASYLAELKRRAKESHIYREYQLLGLEIATALGDEKHKSLYIKLAKQHGGARLLVLAKEVAERQGIKNRGAYFMALLKGLAPAKPPRKTAKKTKKAKTKSHAR